MEFKDCKNTWERYGGGPASVNLYSRSIYNFLSNALNCVPKDDIDEIVYNLLKIGTSARYPLAMYIRKFNKDYDLIPVIKRLKLNQKNAYVALDCWYEKLIQNNKKNKKELDSIFYKYVINGDIEFKLKRR